MSRRCIGFGEREGVCTNDAGSSHSPLWCQECDDARRAHITAQLQKISGLFGATNSPPTSTAGRFRIPGRAANSQEGQA